MSQIIGKFIKDNTIQGSKIALNNDEALRAKSATSGYVDIIKLNSSDKPEFEVFPLVTSGFSPTEDRHLVTKDYVDTQIGGNTHIGVPTDGSYDDGLLAFTSGTLTADAVDEINETLKYLAPSQGYALGSLTGTPGFTITGTNTYSTPLIVGSSSGALTGVSYESSDTNGGSRTDIINDRTFTLTTPDISLWGWRQADSGVFTLKTNGVTDGSVNLAAQFNEANRDSGQTSTPWTSGNLSITSVGPTNSFPKWQDGTAVGNFTASNIRDGYNYITMEHTGLSTGTQTTYTRKFWYSPETTPTASSAAINGTGADTNTPNTGSTTVWLSGVKFYNAGTYNSLAVTVNNPYGTTYPAQDMVISSTVLSSVNVSTPTPIVVAGSVTNQTHNITGQSASIQASRRVLLGQTLGITCTPKTNYGNNATAATASVTNLLIDSYATASTDTIEYFYASDQESRRYKSDTDFNTTSLLPNWDETVSLASSSGGYTDGLQVYGGALIYPSGNFTTITAPQAGPNYSGLSGRRYYIREFKTASGRQNFTIQLTGINATALSNLSGSGIMVEMALPTQTKDGSNNFEFKDCLVAYTTDSGKGCLNGAAPSGSNPTWGITAGTKSTANSNGLVIIRISYPSGSSSQISQINFTFVS